MLAPRHRIGYVDGLRGVAVLLVVAHHAVKYSGISPVSPIARVLFHGNHGVELFFVLSGYCLSYPTLARMNRDGTTTFDAVRYAAHRVVRILPPFWIAAALFFTLGLLLASLGFGLPSSMPQTGFSALDVVSQALFIDGNAGKFLNESFWTLPVEFRWYFLFPILLLVWTKSPRAFLTIGAAAFFLTLTRASSIDLFCLPSFMSGIVAAHLRIRDVELGAWPAFVCGVFLVVAVLTTKSFHGLDYPNPLWSVTAFAFVVAAGCSHRLGAFLSFRGITAVGVASYSIYLIHGPVIGFAQSHGVNPVAATALGVSAGFAFWAVAERPFTQTALRARLVAEFEAAFRKWFPRLGIGVSMTLSGRPEAEKAVQCLQSGRGVAV